MIYMEVIGTPLFQWEVGRRLQIIPFQNMRVNSVHFSNPNDLEALVVKPKEEDGMIVADIPNVLLQSGEKLVVHSVNVSSDCTETLRECIFAVRQRAKPSDYVYTEVEILNYETLEKRIKAIEENGVSGGWDGNYAPAQLNVTVGNFAFYDAEYIKSVNIGSCDTVGEFAFFSCQNLKEVSLRKRIGSRNGTTVIYHNAFERCKSLETVYVGNAGSVPTECFYDCANLREVTLSMLPGYSGSSDSIIENRAFANCPKLSSIRNDTERGYLYIRCVYGEAFRGCSSLEKISFFACETIGGSAFSDCISLTSLILHGSTMCEVEFDAFDNTPMQTGEGHIYVESSMYDSYRAGYEAALDQLMPGFFDILFRKIEDYPEICG